LLSYSVDNLIEEASISSFYSSSRWINAI
jgi:hypothetical protein